MSREPEVIVNILRSTDSGTNHESAVNRCHVAADEIERLHRLVGELLPFMVEDSRDGAAMPERSDSDSCEPDCPDCMWRKQSIAWQARVAAGEFADWNLGADPHGDASTIEDEGHVQSAAVAASPHEQDNQSFIDALTSDTLEEIDALRGQLAKLEQKCARLANALNWYERKNPDKANGGKGAAAGTPDTGGETRKENRILWNSRPDNDDTWGGDIDEIVCHDATVHVEQMDDNCWWIGVYGSEGQRWSGNFNVDENGDLRFSQQDSEWKWDLDQSHNDKG